MVLDFDYFVDFIAGASLRIEQRDSTSAVFKAFQPILTDMERRVKSDVKFGNRSTLVHAAMIHIFTASQPLAKASFL